MVPTSSLFMPGFAPLTSCGCSTASEWCKSRHEEVKTWERYYVVCKLTKVGIKLSRKSETSGDATHGGRNKMVEITICGGCELRVWKQIPFRASCQCRRFHQYSQGADAQLLLAPH